MVEADDNVRRWRACSLRCKRQWLNSHDALIENPPPEVTSEPIKSRGIGRNAAIEIYRAAGWSSAIAAKFNVTTELVEEIKAGARYGETTKDVTDAALTKVAVRTAVR